LLTSTPSVGSSGGAVSSALVSWVSHGPVLHSPTHNQKLVCLGHECTGQKLDPFDPLGWREKKNGERLERKCILLRMRET